MNVRTTSLNLGRARSIFQNFRAVGLTESAQIPEKLNALVQHGVYTGNNPVLQRITTVRDAHQRMHAVRSNLVPAMPADQQALQPHPQILDGFDRAWNVYCAADAREQSQAATTCIESWIQLLRTDKQPVHWTGQAARLRFASTVLAPIGSSEYRNFDCIDFRSISPEAIEKASAQGLFRSATFCNVIMRGLELQHRDFSHARFSGADLEGAVFDNSTLHNTEFFHARLKGTSFAGAFVGKDGGLSARFGRSQDFHWPQLNKARNVNLNLLGTTFNDLGLPWHQRMALGVRRLFS